MHESALSRRFNTLSRLRNSIFDDSLHLVQSLEDRLGQDALVAMFESEALRPAGIAQTEFADCGGIVGQIAPDGVGKFWVMIFNEEGRGQRLLQLDASRTIQESVEITEISGIYFGMDNGSPLWFDQESLRFVGPGGVSGPDCSIHADVLGRHVYLHRFHRLGPDAYVAMFSTTDMASKTLLHVAGGKAVTFMPPSVHLPHDLALVEGSILLGEHRSAWVYVADLAAGTVRPYLEYPLSCLLHSLAAGQGNRLWALFNHGSSLALCKDGVVTHFTRDLAMIFGEPLRVNHLWPCFLAVEENEERTTVALSGLFPNRIHFLEFNRSDTKRY